jgi:hypothetical protein
MDSSQSRVSSVSGSSGEMPNSGNGRALAINFPA